MWSVMSHHVIEASLGYFINPLVNIVLGYLILKERMRPLQWAAIGVAALANSYSTAPATSSTPRRSYQVVRIPQYTSLTLGGQLDALAWDGSAGGILALDVAGKSRAEANAED